MSQKDVDFKRVAWDLARTVRSSCQSCKTINDLKKALLTAAGEVEERCVIDKMGAAYGEVPDLGDEPTES